MNGQEIEDEERKLKQAEYKEFILTLFEKRKELEKFSKAMKGLRENALKQDLVAVKNLEETFNNFISNVEEQKLEEKSSFKELARNLQELAVKNLQESLKGRREFDKFFDQTSENFISALQSVDKVIIDKILELINNIEESHTAEKGRLKIQIADLVSENQQLKLENEALKKGIKPRSKEIPSLEEALPLSVQCPVCLQQHSIMPGTKEFKCPICGYVIKIAEEERSSA
jgi:Zn finger protein HypA/HybF involved in hydrogenase expression